MHTEFESQTQQQIWHTVQKINKEWLNNKTEELAYYFHKDMVITGKDLHELSHNRAECIKSYKDFMMEAVVHDYKESDPIVNVIAYTAVISYKFDINYTMKGKTYQESGRDLFVMIKEDERWQAVWRTLLPDSKN
jgi:hypothetical protein